MVYWLRLSTSTAGGVGSMFNITIREMQIKTQVPSHIGQNGHHFKSTNNKCQSECWRKKKRNLLLHCWWECKLVLPLQKTVELLYDEQSHAKKNMVRKDTGTCVHYSTVPDIEPTYNVHWDELIEMCGRGVYITQTLI